MILNRIGAEHGITVRGQCEGVGYLDRRGIDEAATVTNVFPRPPRYRLDDKRRAR